MGAIATGAMSNRSDAELAAAAADGDDAAIIELINRHESFVRNELRRELSSRHEADEVWAIVREAIRKGLPAVERVEDPRAWMLTVARHKSIDHARSVERRLRRDDRFERERPSATPFDQALVDVDALKWALCRLSAGDREVLFKYFWAGLRPKEIAREMGVTAGAVRKQLKVAVGRLRYLLRDDQKDGT